MRVMQRLIDSSWFGMSACCLLLLFVTTACTANGVGIPYAEWVDQNEFKGASEYWLQKTQEIQIPDAETVPFPRYPGSSLFHFEDNSNSKEGLNRLILLTTDPFPVVRDWYISHIPTFCTYEKKDRPVPMHVIARRCDSDSRKAGNYDLFTTNPNITVKRIGSHLRGFYGNFVTAIEIAYRPAE
jgi:hypothetical protein